MGLRSLLNAAAAIAALGISFASTAPAQAAELRCGSSPGAYNYCRTDTSRGVSLRYQHSGYGCYQNDTWGFDPGGVWVANGCSATFDIGEPERDDDNAAAVGLGILALGILGAVAANNNDDAPAPPPPPPPPGPGGYGSYGPPGPGGYGSAPPPGGYGSYPPPPPPPGPGPGYGPPGGYGSEPPTIVCNSNKNKYTTCPVRIRNYAELVRQKSRSACRFNKTWGYDRNKIWVKSGCRAEFAIY
jgi:hypothetical protein